VEYLGVIISEGQVRMDPIKVNGIMDWPTPKIKCDIQSFLGLCNFYRQFIHHFSDVAHPLNELTGNTPFNWTSECQNAFDDLKTCIMTALILTIPNNKDKFQLETDASDYAMGAVLSQCQEGKWKPIGFMWKSMNDGEQKYDIYNQELLAIITALKMFQNYLMGARETFEIWMDHANLLFFWKPQDIQPRQARWQGILSGYHFTLHHVPGKTNMKADILSRLPGFERGVNGTKNVILLPPTLFSKEDSLPEDTDQMDVCQVEHQIAPINFCPQIFRARENLEPTVNVIMKKGPTNWKISDNDVQMFKGRIYVPVDKLL
jgi:hypothetical protein